MCLCFILFFLLNLFYFVYLILENFIFSNFPSLQFSLFPLSGTSITHKLDCMILSRSFWILCSVFLPPLLFFTWISSNDLSSGSLIVSLGMYYLLISHQKNSSSVVFFSSISTEFFFYSFFSPEIPYMFMIIIHPFHQIPKFINHSSFRVSIYFPISVSFQSSSVSSFPSQNCFPLSLCLVIFYWILNIVCSTVDTEVKNIY